jgi:hypothetical protein
MTEIKIGEHTLLLYSSIRELPISLSKKMSNYLLQDVGIGSSVTDIDDHLSRAMIFVQSDQKENAFEELKNLRLNLFSMLGEIDYKSKAFGCLIHSVDGAAIIDRSDEGMSALVERIGISEGDLDEYLADIKKNWIPNAA